VVGGAHRSFEDPRLLPDPSSEDGCEIPLLLRGLDGHQRRG
jgi:hypothetical protein